MPKMKRGSAILDAILIPPVDAGGKEDKPPRLAGPGFTCLKRLTPAGVGGFLDPLKIKLLSKDVVLSIDRRVDPPKTASGRGFGKT